MDDPPRYPCCYILYVFTSMHMGVLQANCIHVATFLYVFTCMHTGVLQANCIYLRCMLALACVLPPCVAAGTRVPRKLIACLLSLLGASCSAFENGLPMCA